MTDWIPSLTTTGALAVALWLFRSAIANRLTKSVQHEYDTKLEAVRADFRKSEEMLRADIRAREKEIDSLRSGALAGMVSRQTAVDRRRLEAIDQLWSGVIAMGSAKGAAALMASIKYEPALKETAKNPRAKEVFEVMAKAFDPSKLSAGDAMKARPYVSAMAWALFSAHQSIHGLAVGQLQLLKLGLDIPGAMDIEAIKKLVKTALPQYADYIDKFGSASFYQLIDELEKGILIEFSAMLSGKDADNASVERAAAILRAAEEVKSNIEKGGETSGGADVVVRMN